MDITEILKQAAKAVEDADLPDDLRKSGFEKAVDLASGVKPAPATAPQEGPEDTPNEGEQPQWVDTLAKKLEITPELVTQVYTYDDGELGIEIPHQWLGNSKKVGMQDLTRIVTAGRQALDLETATSTKDIRPILDEYGVRDDNYSTHVDELKDEFIIKPDGQNKTLKASKPTMTSVGERIKALSGG